MKLNGWWWYWLNYKTTLCPDLMNIDTILTFAATHTSATLELYIFTRTILEGILSKDCLICTRKF